MWCSVFPSRTPEGRATDWTIDPTFNGPRAPPAELTSAEETSTPFIGGVYTMWPTGCRSMEAATIATISSSLSCVEERVKGTLRDVHTAGTTESWNVNERRFVQT